MLTCLRFLGVDRGDGVEPVKSITSVPWLVTAEMELVLVRARFVGLAVGRGALEPGVSRFRFAGEFTVTVVAVGAGGQYVRDLRGVGGIAVETDSCCIGPRWQQATPVLQRIREQ